MKPNDEVIVHFTRNDIFTFQNSPMIDAVLLHIPADVGDNLIFKTLNGGSEFTVNPVSSDYIGMELVKECNYNF